MSASTQHLNLLDEHVRPPKQRYTAMQGLVAAGVMIVLLTGLDLGLRWGAHSREVKVAALQGELSRLQARFDAPSPLAAVLAQEASQLEQLRTRDESLQGLIRAIAAGTAGQSKGYSGWLQALWRQGGTEPLWLTGFRTDGSEIEIAGRMLHADALPAYLRRLENEPLFRGKQFAQLSVAPNALNERVSDFSLNAHEGLTPIEGPVGQMKPTEVMAARAASGAAR